MKLFDISPIGYMSGVDYYWGVNVTNYAGTPATLVAYFRNNSQGSKTVNGNGEFYAPESFHIISGSSAQFFIILKLANTPLFFSYGNSTTSSSYNHISNISWMTLAESRNNVRGPVLPISIYDTPVSAVASTKYVIPN